MIPPFQCLKFKIFQMLLTLNTTYQDFVTLQPDWRPFNSLGADVINKQKYKTGKVFDAVLASKCNRSHSKSREFPNSNVKRLLDVFTIILTAIMHAFCFNTEKRTFRRTF